MSIIVLDNFPWKIDVEQLIEKYHIPRQGEDIERLKALAREAEIIGRPKALFKNVIRSGQRR